MCWLSYERVEVLHIPTFTHHIRILTTICSSWYHKLFLAHRAPTGSNSQSSKSSSVLSRARLTTTLCYPLKTVIDQPPECVLIIFYQDVESEAAEDEHIRRLVFSKVIVCRVLPRRHGDAHIWHGYRPDKAAIVNQYGKHFRLPSRRIVLGFPLWSHLIQNTRFP